MEKINKLNIIIDVSGVITGELRITNIMLIQFQMINQNILKYIFQ